MSGRGGSKRGSKTRGGRGAKPQRGCRSVPTEEEVMARNMATEERSSSSSEAEDDEEDQEQTTAAAADDDCDDDPMVVRNLNRNPRPHSGPEEMSRREREAIEKAKHAALMQKLHAEGKTARAKADLERLAEVRRRREEAERARANKGTAEASNRAR